MVSEGPTADRPLTDPLAIYPDHVSGISRYMQLRFLNISLYIKLFPSAKPEVLRLGFTFQPYPFAFPVHNSTSLMSCENL
jgi:hypothetical protein